MTELKPILLVEDDIVDMMTVKRALRDLNITNDLVHRENGEEALQYLNNESNAKPGIILLDLNMPKMNGIEFLKTIQTDNRLNKIPVVVLTTSKAQNDITESFKYGAAGYVIKYIDYEKSVKTIEAIVLSWINNEKKQDGEINNGQYQIQDTSYRGQ